MITRVTGCVALTLALLAPFSASAEDLAEIYQYALERDAQLQVAEANYRAALQALPIARSARKPQLFLGAEAALRQTDNSETGSNENTTLGAGVNFVQSLYDRSIGSDIDIAEVTAESAANRFAAERQALVLRVAEAYFGVLAAQDNVDFAYAERTAIARQLEQAQQRFEVGLIAITDVHEAQARFDSAEAQAISAENQLENALQALDLITGGAAIRSLVRVADDFPLLLPDPADAERWVEMALDTNLDLLNSRLDVRIAQLERDKTAAIDGPTLDLTASINSSVVDDDNLGDFDQDDATVALELQVPLYTGGRSSAQLAGAEAELAAARNALLLQTRLASQQARIAYLDVVSGISQVKALRQALESSNIALEATQAGFEVGTRTSVDVLVSLRETYRAQRDYAGARYDYLVNSLRLRQAAGTLGDDDLLDISSRLTPP